MTKIVLREKMVARMERNKKIVEAYRKLRKEHPDVSYERIFATIAEDYDITSGAIRSICAKSGEYVKRSAYVNGEA